MVQQQIPAKENPQGDKALLGVADHNNSCSGEDEVGNDHPELTGTERNATQYQKDQAPCAIVTPVCFAMTKYF